MIRDREIAASEKGDPVVRPASNATGLLEASGLPNWTETDMHGKICIRRAPQDGPASGRAAARRHRTRLLRGVVAVAVAGSPVSLLPEATPAAAAEPPSIVVIMTDDQRWDTLWAMPNVRSELVGHGVTFENAFASNPLCCPSRASTLTGKYSHATGVWKNQLPFGGFEAFDDSSTIATWLQAQGYETGLFGKYLNRYWLAAEETGYVPPGWSRWAAFPRSGFYDYDLNIDGTIQTFGSGPESYSTDVLAGAATSFIHETTGPFLLWFTPYAPHEPATPGPGYEDAFHDLGSWRPRSYNEADLTDKPSWLRGIPPMKRSKQEKLDAFRVNQYRSLGSVDDAVGDIVDALEETGRLSNTLIVFMSDNGFAWGEHRWRGKKVAYEESLRIPMVVRYDPLVAEARVDDQIVMNIDVAPTAADVAGVDAPGAEGMSLLEILADPTAPWRTAMLIEHMAKDGDQVPTFCGVRTARYKYMYYASGDEEFYDLARDPFELHNIVSDPIVAGLVSGARARLSRMCVPAPPGLVLPF